MQNSENQTWIKTKITAIRTQDPLPEGYEKKMVITFTFFLSEVDLIACNTFLKHKACHITTGMEEETTKKDYSN